MNFLWWIFVITAGVVNVAADECLIKKSNSKLICYYSKLIDVDVNGCYCSHVVLPPDADVKSVEKFRENWKGAKILVTVNEFNQGLLDLLKKTKIDGLEVKLKKFDSKNDINDFISTIRTKIGSDLFLAVSVPSQTELVAKYYDFKGLSKHVDVFILQTGFLGASTNVTFHPSRLSGLWDMQNTDSLVDLTTGLGLPPSKLIITAPVQGFQFTLQNEEFSAPGSPAVALKTITRDGICYQMKNGGNWTLERDEDQAGPYIFNSKKWIAFEDPTSIDIKAKYSRIRGLAGLALKDLSQDGGKNCGATLLEAAFNGLVKQSRAPRAAVLHSFERDVLETKNSIEEVKVSPYRISRVIDTEGKWHVIRQDTRTEFTCSRQGYFVHPRSCNRFYRCVKFNQQSDEFSVFEFDCPAGLAFDERVEVCVWPGSLPQGQPCSGSSEIAPVPRQRFACPGEPGYYADPENCRWFFACLDHGKSSLEAYEFRCPFGLVFDSERLLCEWPWLVPKCSSGNLNLVTEYHYGSSKQSLSSYDGLGDLGTIKLGGISGRIEQPIVYSNVDGHSFGSLGFKATNILYNAGLLKSNQFQSGSGHSASSGGSYSYSGGRTNSNGNYYSGGSSSSNANSARLLNQVGNSYSYSGDGAGHSALNFHSGDTTGGSYSYSAGGAHSAATSSNAEGGVNAGHSTVTFNLHSGAATGVKSGNYYAGEGASLGGISNQIHSGATAGAKSGSYNYYAGEGASLGATSSNAGTLNQVHLGATTGAKSGSYNYYAGEGASLGATSSNAATLNQVHSGVATGTNSGSYNYYAGEGAFHSASASEGGISLNNAGGSYSYSSGLNQASGGSDSYSGGAGGHSGENLIALNQGEQYLNAHSGISSAGGSYGYADGKTDQLDLNRAGESYSYSSQSGEGDIKLDTSSFGLKTTGQHNVESGKSYQTFNQDFKKNIEIVGGGYSAVGQSNSGVEISNLQGISYSTTPSTVTVSVPTVTSVPIPNLKVPSGFESYDGGVIANVPELQYKIDFKNVTQSYDSNGGYVYQKPSIKFEESPIKVTYSTPTPFTVKPEIESVTIQPAVSTYSYSSAHSNVAPARPTVIAYTTPASSPQVVTVGYNYPKPAVKFEEIPQTQKPVEFGQIPIVKSEISLGYNYPKPAIKFEEIPTAKPSARYNFSQVEYDFTRPAVKPYIEQFSVKNSGSYVYNRPSVEYKQVVQPEIISYNVQPKPKPVVTTFYQQPENYYYTNQQGVSKYNFKDVIESVTQKVSYLPPVEKKPKPAVISSYSYTYQPTVQPVVVSTVKPYISIKQEEVKPSVGYDYPKPAVTFVEQPKTVVKPAVVSSYSYIAPQPSVAVTVKPTIKQVFSGYDYRKPAVTFVEQPQPVKTVYSYQSTQRPPITFYEQKNVAVDTASVKPAVVSSYSYIAPKQPQVEVKGYEYPKPSVTFIEEPKPFVVETSTVSSNNYLPPKQPQIEPKGYEYPKPTVTFIEEPKPVITSTLKPAIVSSYSYQAPQKPAITFYKQTNTVAASIKPAVVSSYSYIAPKQPQVVVKEESRGYEYPRPAFAFIEQPVSTTVKPAAVSSYSYEYIAPKKPDVTYIEQPKVKPAVVTSYSYIAPRKPQPAIKYETQTHGYDYPKPTVQLVEEPTYEHLEPVKEVHFIKKTAYTTGQSNKAVIVENYENYVQTTPKPTFLSTVASIAPSTWRYYDSRLESTPKTVSEEQPIVVVEPKVVTSTYLPPPTREYLPVTTVKPAKSRIRITTPTIQYLPVTTPQPVREYLPVKQNPVTPEPANEYLPVEPTREYLPVQRKTIRFKVTTPAPANEYLPVEPTREYLPVQRKTIRFKVTTPEPANEYIPVEPTREYLPVQRKPIRIKVTTPEPANEYLPVEPTREYLPVQRQPIRIKVTTPEPENEYLSFEPVREYLPVTQKAIRIKVTTPQPALEYLPSVTEELLKISSTPSAIPSREYLPVNTRRPVKVVKVVRPVKTIVKQNDLHPMLSAKLGAQCTCVRTSLNKKKTQKVIIVEDDDDDDGYVVENDENTVVENYNFEPNKEDVIIATKNDEEEKVSDQQILKAVKTGLKLVKQAAKEGAKEGAEEALKNSSRVRNNIECQRAGLFRHPNQCNKFYSCRWDCTKNKFTLHTFNCPVHLTFDGNLGACNWPSQGPACADNTLLPAV